MSQSETNLLTKFYNVITVILNDEGPTFRGKAQIYENSRSFDTDIRPDQINLFFGFSQPTQTEMNRSNIFDVDGRWPMFKNINNLRDMARQILTIVYLNQDKLL